jgi:glycosyltransferase involved in cell wall biosynthesis
MKIAQIAPPWFTVPPQGYGGSERVVAELTEGLTRRGHDVTLFASGGSSTGARLVSPLAVPPAPSDLGSGPEDLFHTTSAYLRAGEFDVIHDHSGQAGPALGAMLGGVPPVVVTLHGPWTGESRRFYGLVGERVHLVAISNAQRRINTDVRYAGMVHNGLDPERFPFRSEKEDFLCFVGRASPDKGVLAAIDIAERSGLPLVMVMKVNEREELRYWTEAIAPRLTSSVKVLLGADHALKTDVMSRARALLFPIQWDEPFGLVMTEAMACGTPVVACGRGSVPEVVVDGVTGFIVDPADPVGGAGAVLDRLGSLDPAACRTHVERWFSTRCKTDGYEAVYREVLATSDGPEGDRDVSPSVTVHPPSHLVHLATTGEVN